MDFKAPQLSLVKRVTFIVLVSTIIAACGGGSSPSSGTTRVSNFSSSPYKIIDLGVGYAGDINELGYVTGVSDGQAYIYDGTTKNLIGTIGTDLVSPVGINNKGEVVAIHRPVGSPSNTSVAYYNGTDWTLIGKLGGEFAWPNDINDSGQIAGTYKPSGSGNRGFIYTSSSFTVIPLPESGNYNDTYEINKNALVSGTYKNADNIFKSYVFDGTNVNVVGSFPQPSRQDSYNYGLNDTGDSVGKSHNSIFQYRAFLYKNSTMTELGTLGGNSVAYDINNQNIIAGNYIDDNSDNKAFIHDGTTMKDLTNIVNNQDWILSSAKHINDKDMIIGQGLINNEVHGYLLIPQ